MLATVMNETVANVAKNAVEVPFIERRRSTRYQFTATVELVDMQSRARVQARTSDLSRGGCYVDTTSPLPAATTVKMRLTKDKRSFDVQARVVYSLPGMGMGLVFTSAAPEQLKVLKRWLGELSGDLMPELSTPEENIPVSRPRGSADQAHVLGTLLMELMRQGVLPQQKGNDMLSHLLASN